MNTNTKSMCYGAAGVFMGILTVFGLLVLTYGGKFAISRPVLMGMTIAIAGIAGMILLSFIDPTDYDKAQDEYGAGISTKCFGWTAFPMMALLLIFLLWIK